jgi:hypothetical protein
MPSTYALEGLSALCQAKIDRSIASQPYARSMILGLIEGYSGGGGDEVKIGRPGVTQVIAGEPIEEAEKISMQGMAAWAPRIQKFKTNNTAVTGSRGNMRSVNNPTQYSTGQVGQAAAYFPWMAYLQTPFQVDHWDLDMALQRAEGKGDMLSGMELSTVTDEAVEAAMQEHLDQLASRLLYGSPSDQAENPSDDLQGVITGLTDLNRYGNIDRSLLPVGHPWRPQQITTAKPKDIYQLILDANITQKANIYGGGINAVLCGGDNYKLFKQQILSRGGAVVQPGTKTGMEKMVAKYASLGVQSEVLCVDGKTYVVHEPFLDTCYATYPDDGQGGTAGNPIYTAKPNNVLCLNLKYWRYITHPKYNMTVKPLEDISNKSTRAPRTNIGFIETVGIFGCRRPNLLVMYTNLV